MAGIRDTNAIDLVVRSKDGDADLVIVEENEWSGSEEQIEFLKKKINSYIFFFKEGQLGEMHPELKNRPTSIILMSSSELDPKTKKFLLESREILASQNLGLEFRPMKKNSSTT